MDNCPLCYSVEVAYPIRGTIHRQIMIRNQDIDDARSWANHYREQGYTVCILARPAIPYVGPLPRVEVI